MLQETVKLLLLVLRTLSSDQVKSDLVLSVFGQVHIFHRSVGYVDLLLETALFLAHFGHQHSHLTEQDSVVQNQRDQYDKDERDFELGTRAHLISTESQHRHVEHHHVLVPL